MNRTHLFFIIIRRCRLAHPSKTNDWRYRLTTYKVVNTSVVVQAKGSRRRRRGHTNTPMIIRYTPHPLPIRNTLGGPDTLSLFVLRSSSLVFCFVCSLNFSFSTARPLRLRYYEGRPDLQRFALPAARFAVWCNDFNFM